MCGVPFPAVVETPHPHWDPSLKSGPLDVEYGLTVLVSRFLCNKGHLPMYLLASVFSVEL